VFFKSKHAQGERIAISTGVCVRVCLHCPTGGEELQEGSSRTRFVLIGEDVNDKAA
jgi:hypothetical protein